LIEALLKVPTRFQTHFPHPCLPPLAGMVAARGRGTHFRLLARTLGRGFLGLDFSPGHGPSAIKMVPKAAAPMKGVGTFARSCEIHRGVTIFAFPIRGRSGVELLRPSAGIGAREP